MTQEKYLDESQGYPVILFPTKTVPKNFEGILRQCYRKTVLKQTSTVKFDFSKVNRCELFELSLISLWMSELKQMNKRVMFRTPNNKEAYKFLVSYRFNCFLNKFDIEVESTTNYKSSEAPLDLLRAPFYPLTFSDEKEFKQILEDLEYGNRLEVVLGDVKDADIVKSGAIRDVVLTELIDNLRLHAETSSANIIMTKLGVDYSGGAATVDRRDVTAISEAMVRGATMMEKPFFEKLAGKSYLSLVIADKGEGITSTLKEAYLNDEIISPRSQNPSDGDILEYAFLYHSTKRPLSERLGDIERVISDDAKKYPPPTGLYQLKEITREFQGLLYARSGNAVVCYDFYNNPLTERPTHNYEIPELKNLANFRGTQYKIYFPVEIPPKQIAFTTLQPKLDFSPAPRTYEYFAVNQYVEPETKYELLGEAERLNDIFSVIDKNILNKSETERTIIFDFINVTKLSAKALHYLLFEIMQRQSQSVSAIAVNIDADQRQWQKGFDLNIDLKRAKKPIALFNEQLEVKFYGASLDEIELLHSLLDEDVVQTDQMQLLAKKYDHLFSYDIGKNRFVFVHSRSNIIRTIKEGVKKQISDIIMSEPAKIFHERTKVLLPTRMYCEGYFEIYKLLANSTWANLVSTWFSLWLREVKPDFVVSITNHVGTITAAAIEKFRADSGSGKFASTESPSPKHINLKTPIHDPDLFDLVLKLKKGQTGIIITEVIGTFDTLKSVLQLSQHTEITNVLSIVNAAAGAVTSFDLKGKSYAVEAVATYPLKFHPALPKGWSYKNVREVDPANHSLLESSTGLEGPIWKKIQILEQEINSNEFVQIKVNEFLNDCVIPTNSFAEGHFINDDKHILYLFNIPLLTKYFLKEITETIVANIKRDLPKIEVEGKQITHVLYLASNPGMETIANSVSAQFAKCLPVAVSFTEPYLPPGQENLITEMDAIIFLDDALVSGENAYKAYDIAERYGASHIFAFAVIKRGDDLLARRFENFSQYGRTTIQAQYLCDVEMPVFNEQDCPLCERAQELEDLEIIEDELFNKFIDKEKSKLIELPIDVIDKQDYLKSNGFSTGKGERLAIRWKLELAKKRNELGIRNELARIVKDHQRNAQSTLSLFNVIFREKYVFLRSEVREIIFYDSFIKEIKKACDYFLSDISRLSEEDLESVIFLLITFEEDFFDYYLIDICRKTLDSDEKFMRVLSQIFAMEEVFEYPGKMARLFRELLEDANISKELESTITNVCLYWDKQEQVLKTTASTRVADFKNLLGFLIHEITHHKDNLISSIDANAFDTSKIIASWSIFYENLVRIRIHLRKLTDNHVSAGLLKKLNPSVNELNFQMKQGNDLVTSIQSLHSDSDETEQSKDDLKRFITKIHTVLYGEDGIVKSLEDFKTSIHDVAYDILIQQDKDLKQKNILPEKNLPQGACLVFGEYPHIAQIFQNLIENVHKHSGGTALQMAAVINETEETVTITFLDNGKGIGNSSSFKSRGGLRNVFDLVQANCGSFDIKKLEEHDDEYHLGYRTKAVVILPSVSERKKL